MNHKLLQAQDALGKLTVLRKRPESPERRAAQLVIKRRTDVIWNEALDDAKPRTQTEAIVASSCIDSEKLTTEFDSCIIKIGASASG